MSLTSEEEADVEDELGEEKDREKEKENESGYTRSRDARRVTEKLRRKRAKIQRLRHRLRALQNDLSRTSATQARQRADHRDDYHSPGSVLSSPRAEYRKLQTVITLFFTPIVKSFYADTSHAG